MGRTGRAAPQLKIWVHFFGFQNNFFFETLRSLQVNKKKLRLDLSYYWEFFQKYKICFGLMVNETVLEWDSLSHHCRNLYIGTVSCLIGGFRCASHQATVQPFTDLIQEGLNPDQDIPGCYAIFTKGWARTTWVTVPSTVNPIHSCPGWPVWCQETWPRTQIYPGLGRNPYRLLGTGYGLKQPLPTL